jgi:filamentous hemagglutinin family protein
MRTLKTILKKHYFRKAVIYFLTYCLLINPAVVFALNNTDLTSSTGLNSSSWGNDTVLNTANGAILNWNNFNTSAGQSVTFNQPGIDAAVLNRISGAATQFNGSLSSNGNVFIVNPAGVYFGAGSVVNVNQLVASTLGITNEDFIAGNYEFIAGGGTTGGVINNGSITAAEGAALIGKYVQNNGTITTGLGGFAVMAAGDRVFLGEPGGNIIVEMDAVTTSGANDGKVINNGTITSREGTVALASGDVTAPADISSLAAGDIYTTAITLPKVSGGTGTIQQNGTINTNGVTGDGGSIGLTAGQSVTLGSSSTTSANAGTSGDAGLVVVHSTGQTNITSGSTISATGGHAPFNLEGDFDDIVDTTIEITGEHVNLAGNINASATGGDRGKIIIDALDMTVENGNRPASPADNTVYEKWIEAQSQAATDVELVAHSKEAGNITVNPLSDGILSVGSGDIVLRTKYNTGGITFNGGTSIRSDDGGNIYMLAGEGGITVGNITSYLDQHDPREPGKIRLFTTNYGDITTGSLSVEGGSYDEISVVANGNATINGSISTYAHQVDESLRIYQARTCMVSEHGDVTINGGISLYTQGKWGTTADLHIDAGQDIAINPNGGQITVEAKTVTEGPANVSAKFHAGMDTDPENPLDTGSITFNGKDITEAGNVISLKAQAGGGVGAAQISSTDVPTSSDEYGAVWNKEVSAVYDEDGSLTQGAHARLEINKKHTETCNECPAPPGLVPPIDPIGTPDEASTHMGDATSGNVLTNDTHEPGRTLTVISYTQPEHGTVTVLANGDYVYTPEAGYVGDDSFTYKASDGESITGSIAVTINMWNNLPTPAADSDTTHMGTSVTINIADLLSNDTDQDNDSLSFGSISYTGNGTLVDNHNGTLTYTPAAGYVGTDSFSYTITDGQLNNGTPVTVSATATITMQNQLPIAGNDSASTHMGDQVAGTVLSNDSDVDGDSLTVVLDGVAPQHGTLVLNTDGTYTYTPTAGYVGSDTFKYTITDGQLSGGVPVTVTGTANITIGNNLPQVTDDTANAHMGTAIQGNVLTNDSDLDGDSLTVVLDGVAPQHGTLVLNTDGTYTYTPTAGYVGSDTFKYTVTDGQLSGGLPVTKTGTATITIGNNLPVANNDNASTILNQPVVINVLSNDTDIDSDVLTSTLLTGDNDPLHGTIIHNADGTITYTPNVGYSGNDYFRYFISDGQLPVQYAMGTVFVTVLAAASIPAAPLPENPDIEISGCPALLQWTAQEIGSDQQAIQVWMTNTLASSRDIQPCDACASLREAAIVLKDTTYLDALRRVVSGVATGDAPLSEEQIASLRTSINNSTEAEADLAYAKDYIDTLQRYVNILDTNLEMSQADSLTVAVDNYIAPLAQENANLAVFLTAMMTTPER